MPGQVLSVEVMGRRLRALPKQLEASLVRALTAGQEEGLDVAHKGLTEGGIGRSLWGPRPKSARAKKPRLWTPSRPAWRGDKLVGVLVAYGLAAMIQTGDRTAAHEIPRRATRGRGSGKVLAFDGGGGRVFARRVQHPGGAIPRRPYLERGQAAMAARFGTEAEGEMQRVLDREIG